MMFAHWMLPDEPLRLPKLAGAIIALGGVTVICARLLGFNGPLAFWGGVGVVVGAASAAFANVLVKARSMQLAPAMLAAWQMIFGTAPLLLLGFAVDGNPARFHWTVSSVFCLLYLAVIGSALTFLLLYWLLPRLTVAQLQSISLITPPGAVMLGWLLGGETFPLSSLLGAGAGPCGSVDDFPKSVWCRTADSRRVIISTAELLLSASSSYGLTRILRMFLNRCRV